MARSVHTSSSTAVVPTLELRAYFCCCVRSITGLPVYQYIQRIIYSKREQSSGPELHVGILGMFPALFSFLSECRSAWRRCRCAACCCYDIFQSGQLHTSNAKHEVSPHGADVQASCTDQALRGNELGLLCGGWCAQPEANLRAIINVARRLAYTWSNLVRVLPQ